jgi:hypothetical protein
MPRQPSHAQAVGVAEPVKLWPAWSAAESCGMTLVLSVTLVHDSLPSFLACLLACLIPPPNQPLTRKRQAVTPCCCAPAHPPPPQPWSPASAVDIDACIANPCKQSGIEAVCHDIPGGSNDINGRTCSCPEHCVYLEAPPSPAAPGCQGETSFR